MRAGGTNLRKTAGNSRELLLAAEEKPGARLESVSRKRGKRFNNASTSAS
jgi:hypothetical protein